MKKNLKKIGNIINFVLEFLPIPIIIFGIIIFFDLLPINNLKKLFLENSLEKGTIQIVNTLVTVVDAMIITSLSVFGSTKSYAVILLSEEEKMRNKFFFYIYGTIFSSLFVFIFSVFFNKNFYTYFVTLNLSFFISYAHISVIMFMENIKNYKEEENNNLKEKEELFYRIDNLIKKMNKILDVMNEIKNK